jgi:superfamily II DNA/RNA helicase
MSIQRVSLPIVIRGQDMIGIAKTGSGKTGAFTIPSVLNVILNSDGAFLGPYVLVLCPTRELAQQTEKVMALFSRAYDLRTVCLFGGECNRRDQSRLCQTRLHIIVATPGPLLDLVKSEVLSMANVSFLVIDEVDNMLCMGF